MWQKPQVMPTRYGGCMSPGCWRYVAAFHLAASNLGFLKSSQTDDAGRVAGYARNWRLIAAIHPQPELVRPGRRFAAWLGNRPELSETAPMAPRVDVVEEADVPFSNACHLHPELLVAAGPEVPGIASLALLRREVLAFVAVVGFLLCNGNRRNRNRQAAKKHGTRDAKAQLVGVNSHGIHSLKEQAAPEQPEAVDRIGKTWFAGGCVYKSTNTLARKAEPYRLVKIG